MRPGNLPTFLPGDPSFESDAEAAPSPRSGEHFWGNRAHPNDVGLDANYPSVGLTDNPAVPTFAADLHDRTGVSSVGHTNLHFGEQGATLMGTQPIPLCSKIRQFLVGTGLVVLFGINKPRITSRGARFPGHGEPRQTRQEYEDER